MYYPLGRGREPAVSEGEIVRVVVAPDGKGIAAETWLNGAWVPGGDPAIPAFGRPLSAEEIAALPKSSAR